MAVVGGRRRLEHLGARAEQPLVPRVDLLRLDPERQLDARARRRLAVVRSVAPPQRHTRPARIELEPPRQLPGDRKPQRLPVERGSSVQVPAEQHCVGERQPHCCTGTSSAAPSFRP